MDRHDLPMNNISSLRGVSACVEAWAAFAYPIALSNIHTERDLKLECLNRNNSSASAILSPVFLFDSHFM